MSGETFELTPGGLTISDSRRLSEAGTKIALDAGGRTAIEAALSVVSQVIGDNRLVYGINTGVGSLSDSVIAGDQLGELQRRLVLSNAAGTGALLSDRVVRRIMLLKINTLGLGHSGVRMALVDALIGLFNGGAQPCIPSKGSVGASGDLAPLAHLAAALIGAVGCAPLATGQPYRGGFAGLGVRISTR
jgi:histidine ammonia-lyase